MQREILSLIGAALLAGPFLLAQFTPRGILEVIGFAPSDHLPTWLQVSVLAGAYLIEWAPALIGVWIIYYANRKQV